jgi:hypothetical protein
MKKINIIQTILLSVLIFWIGGCQNKASEKLKRDQMEIALAEKQLQLAQDQFQTDLEYYRTENTARLTANEIMVKDFKERMASSKQQMKADLNKTITDLEEKNSAMKNKLNEYKLEGKDQWADFKTEFNHDMDELGTALKNLTVDNTK